MCREASKAATAARAATVFPAPHSPLITFITLTAAAAVLASPAVAEAGFRGGAADRPLTVRVSPRHVALHHDYRVTIRGGPTRGILITSLDFSGRGCPGSVASENRRRLHQWVGINKPYSGRRVEVVTALKPGRRHFCAWVYPRRLATPTSPGTPMARAGIGFEAVR